MAAIKQWREMAAYAAMTFGVVVIAGLTRFAAPTIIVIAGLTRFAAPTIIVIAGLTRNLQQWQGMAAYAAMTTEGGNDDRLILN